MVFHNFSEVFLFLAISFIGFQILETKSEPTERKKLILQPDNEIFNLWKNFPTDAPINFYFFNWTNPEHINNSLVKPQFEEVGPYRFLQENRKSEIVWNDNDTVSYQQFRYWHYSDEEVKSDLEDEITTINPVAITLGYAVRSSNIFQKLAVSYSLSAVRSSIAVKKTVRELLFEGYSDPLLDISKNLAPQASDKFGLFYKKNGSSELNGTFNIGTGEHDDFARLYSWNYTNQTNFYKDGCSEISKSTGDRFQPPLPKTKISFFAPYLCRVITLDYVGEETVHGLGGYKYTIGNYTLDNGTQYPENSCFCGDECLPSGVFNASACADGAPFFISLPHFNKADSYYTSGVEGLSSDHTNHEFSMTIEPNTGIRLKADVRFQVNILLQPDSTIRLFKSIPQKYVLPIMWYEYKPNITPTVAALIKSYIQNNEI